MVKVYITDNNIPEREYIIDVLFKDFLGIEHKISKKQKSNYTEIILSNNNSLKFNDHFFSNHLAPKSYLNIQHFPSSIKFVKKKKNKFIINDDLPILYGDDSITISENEVICGADIFSSTFFMLTRWEEYVNHERDHYYRFSGHSSVAYKNNFLQRPIVNEYVEMLWNMLEHLGIKQKRKKRNYRALITHDVDIPLLWKSPYAFVKKLGGDIIKRRNIKEAHFTINSIFNTFRKKQPDPFNTFDHLMSISEKYGLQSYFFFLCGGNTNEDKGALMPSHPFIKKLFAKIKSRGHQIGLHPSFDSYNNEDIFIREKKLLEKEVGEVIKFGRQHFLRFEVPTTWQLWEKGRMQWDSTMYYPESPGFRCGTCYEFPVFNFLTRKKLKLREIPLTIMDGTFVNYQKSSVMQMVSEVRSIAGTVKQYNGDLVFLWHNSSFNIFEWKNYGEAYDELIGIIS